VEEERRGWWCVITLWLDEFRVVEGWMMMMMMMMMMLVVVADLENLLC